MTLPGLTPHADYSSVPARTRRGAFSRARRELRRDAGALVGMSFLILVVVVALLAPLVAPYDPQAQSLTNRLMPPGWAAHGDWSHPLGTDGLGRDVLSRLIFGARSTLGISVLVVMFATTIGVALGLFAGYLGGRADAIVMRTVDTQFAFPGLLLVITILAAVGSGFGAIVIVLGLLSWMLPARLARGIVLSLKETGYVEAAEVSGAKPRRVICRHILPNMVSPLLTLVVLEFGRIILAEASLSFLGVGIQPPDTSWGLELNLGRRYIFVAWWLVTLPGLAIALTVLSANLVASWLRVITDPQERDKRYAVTVGVKPGI